MPGELEADVFANAERDHRPKHASERKAGGADDDLPEITVLIKKCFFHIHC